jgi:hypothetical protein
MLDFNEQLLQQLPMLFLWLVTPCGLTAAARVYLYLVKRWQRLKFCYRPKHAVEGKDTGK